MSLPTAPITTTDVANQAAISIKNKYNQAINLLSQAKGLLAGVAANPGTQAPAATSSDVVTALTVSATEIQALVTASGV